MFQKLATALKDWVRLAGKKRVRVFQAPPEDRLFRCLGEIIMGSHQDLYRAIPFQTVVNRGGFSQPVTIHLLRELAKQGRVHLAAHGDQIEFVSLTGAGRSSLQS